MIKRTWYTDPEEPNIEADLKYREAHRKTKRIARCQNIVHSFGNCTSILDVGCKSLGFLELVGEPYTEKLQIDYCLPHIVGSVPFQKLNLLDLYKDRRNCLAKYDVVVCLEVLEHVEPTGKQDFAMNLLKLAKKHLVISIPYNWKDTKEVHPHNGINESNLMEWFYPYEADRMYGKEDGGHLIAVFNTDYIREGTTL